MTTPQGEVPLELHVWGPAFGLPSIDAHCIASIVYLGQVLQPDQWRLVIAHDPTDSPIGDFPCLKDGDKLVCGFPRIVRHLQASNLSLDADLTPIQIADSFAIEAHLQLYAVPLLDAHFYISSTNYTDTVRPAWARIVPSPFRQATLNRRCRGAQARTARLGLFTDGDGLDDVPSNDFTQQQEQEARMLSTKPSLLFRPRASVTAALEREQAQTKFKLQEATKELMDVLDFCVQQTGWNLVTSQDQKRDAITSVDCIAFAYLSLFLHSDCENDFIPDLIQRFYPQVCRYVARLRSRLLPHPSLDVETVMAAVRADSLHPKPQLRIHGMPYITSLPTTWTASLRTIFHSILFRVFGPVRLDFLFPFSSFTLKDEPHRTALAYWTSPVGIFLTAAPPLVLGVAAAVYVITHRHLERDKTFFRTVVSRPTGAGFGHAGAALTGFGLGAAGRWR